MTIKFNFENNYVCLKTINFYLASVFLPLLIVIPILIIDTFRPNYEVESSVVMNEQILIDLRVLAGYQNSQNYFEIGGCKKVKFNSQINYRAEITPYSHKGILKVKSRNLDEALEALSLWHTCSINVFKRTIEPYEFELKNLAMIRKRIDLKSIDLKDINEYFKFRQLILNYELMDSYIKEPFSYTTTKVDFNYKKYFIIYLAALAGFMTLLFFLYPFKKNKS